MKNLSDNSNIFVKLYLLLTAYIFLVPFYYLPYCKFFGYEFPFFKYLPLVFIFGLFLCCHKNILYSLKNNVSKIALFYFLMTLLSGIGTSYYKISILKAVYYGISGVLLYFLFLGIKLKSKQIISILNWLVLLGFLLSIYGLITFILKRDILCENLRFAENNVIHPTYFLDMGRISSVLGNPHFLASFLAFLLPLSLYCFSYYRGKKYRNFYMIISFIILLAGLMTFSMEFYLFLGVFYIFIVKHRFILTAEDYKRFKKLLSLMVLVGILVLIVIFLSFFKSSIGGAGKFLENIGGINFIKLANPEGFIYRFQSFKLAGGNAFGNFGFGKGIGFTGSGFNPYHKITMDNFYCLLLFEYGMFPSLVFLCFLLYFFRKNYMYLSRLKDPLLLYILGLSLVSFLISMLFWDVLNHPSLRIIFWSFLGIISSIIENVHKGELVGSERRNEGSSM